MARAGTPLAGWRSFGGPCCITEKGRASAGVVTLVKHYLNSWAPDEGELVRGRLARCHLRLHDVGELTLMACYLYVGEGFTPRNLKILEIAGNQTHAVQFPYISGEDFNNSPEKLNSAIPLTKLRGVTRADLQYPSYVLDGHSSTIDYYMVDRHLDMLVEVQVLRDVPTSPHSPVLLALRGVKDHMVDIVEPYQNVSTQRIFGPMLPPPSYVHLLNQIDGFLEPLGGTAAKYTLQGTVKEEALSLLDTVYD
eukprot:1826045-Pyramimonas_sp.AAC.1